MNSIESTMLEYLLRCKPVTRDNTKVIITQAGCPYGYVTLFDNTIALFDGKIVTLCDGGWRTATTKSRLNALLSGTGYRISATKGEWRLYYNHQDRGIFKNGTTFYIGETQ